MISISLKRFKKETNKCVFGETNDKDTRLERVGGGCYRRERKSSGMAAAPCTRLTLGDKLSEISLNVGCDRISCAMRAMRLIYVGNLQLKTQRPTKSKKRIIPI